MFVFCPLGRHVGNPLKDFVVNLAPKRIVVGNTIYLFPPVIASPASATTAITLVLGTLFILAYVKLSRAKISAQYCTTTLVGSVAAVVRGALGIPLVANYGDPDFAREHGLSRKAFKFCEDLVLARRRAFAVIYVDEVIGRYLDEQYHVPRKVFLPNGGYERGFIPPSPDAERVTRLRERMSLAGKRVVVYAGQITGGYRIDLLPSAAEQVVANFPDAVFMIIGGGDALPKLLDQVRGLNLEGNFRMVGPVPYANLSEYLALSEVGLQLLNDMCMGTKVMMYMANHVAAVSAGKWYDRYGVFLKNRENAILVPPETKALASGIEELLANPEERMRIVESAWKSIEPYSWDRHADVVLSLLHQAVDSSHQGT